MAQRWIIFLGLLLLVPKLNFSSQPPPAKPPANPGVKRDSWSEARYKRSKEAWRESLAQALTQTTKADLELARTISCQIEKAFLEHEVNPLLIAGLLTVESNGNPWAISHMGAVGLMQVLPSTAEFIAENSDHDWQGPASLHETEISIRLGAWYYKYLKEQFPDNEKASIAAYNWGPENISWRLRNQHPLPQVYVTLVLEAQEKIRSLVYQEMEKRLWWRLDPRLKSLDRNGESNEECR